jgi:hypothetical protein
LEAAPAETEFTAQWGAFQKDVGGTSTAVGTGKRNTQIIVDRLKQLGETNRAAQLCDTLSYDGFDDWFLPSKDELNLMYTNLRQKGLGEFSSTGYWSSSEMSYNPGAWGQVFSDGVQGGSRNFLYSVRAVRAF